ncbi:toll-like receptor 2 [Callorhinchus milii]|uniref:toll-like receptor 2 n=1 Tax=Callorhinchus milii TaxID=7868 RepID=UPI001C3FC45F|nr:toll-like receptor 2 [Callorhinchus milii]
MAGWPGMFVAAAVLLCLPHPGSCVRGEAFFLGRQCSVVGDVADCSRRGLSAVPSGLPPSIAQLDLSHNRIESLLANDFSDVPLLRVLNLAFNRVRDIHPGALAHTALLQHLDLYHNELLEIPAEAVGNLRLLQVLNIAMNNYTSFVLGGAFANLHSLRSLTIGTARTDVLNASDFTALQNVSVTHLNVHTGSPLMKFEPGVFAPFKMLQSFRMNFTVDDDPVIFSKVLLDLNKTKVSEFQTDRVLLNPVKNMSIDFFYGLEKCSLLRNLTLVAANFTDQEITSLLKNVYLSQITSVEITNSSYTDKNVVSFFGLKNVTKLSPLEKVTINQIFHLNMTYPKFAINFTLFPSFSKLKISHTGMNKVECFFMKLKFITWLDFSSNLLDEEGLWWTNCKYTIILPRTTELYISNNKFTDLQIISSMVSLMPSITLLDVGYNYITDIDDCSWPPTLETLILRNNDISKDSRICTSPQLKVLDLSYTRMEAVPYYILDDAKSLRELYLTGNNIHYIQPEIQSSSLQVLHVDYNTLGIITKGTFQLLPKIRALKLGNNLFYCMCDLYWFRQTFDKSLLVDWPQKYVCSYPENLAEKTLDCFNPSIVSCDKRIAIGLSVVITAVVVALVLGLGYYFDAVWYIRMGWIWVGAKRRGYKHVTSGEAPPFEYNAFISYSHMDSDWVEGTLVPRLENSGSNLKLCVHERDFTPGEWVVDNIIRCIEGSSKTLFVLSKSFVNSEWCNYELYFAQHRIMEQHQDSLVLVLLESLPKNSLPNKFCRLRRLLNRKTYLEWPAEESKQAIFWASLQAILQTTSSPTNPVT